MGVPLKPIYLDYHATTPVDPKVLEAMLPWFTEHFGNPASRSHPYGWQGSEAVEVAREQIARLINVQSKDIIFTSGATEGLNMAIKGLAESSGHTGKHIITVATEHHAVLDTVDWLRQQGYDITILPVDGYGILDPDQLKSAIRMDTIMAIVMWANNETGVIQDISNIGALCKESGIPLICDATQAAGKIDIDPLKNHLDILAISAHKLYGPKGTGAVWINPSMRVKPAALIHGGGHERGFRSGTLNVPGIVGFGVASELRLQQMHTDQLRIGKYRDQFEKAILSSLEEVTINGDQQNRLPTVSNLKVGFVDSQSVMTRFRSQLAISSGSACSSANPEPSHVLLAMGLRPVEAKGSFRISLGTPTTAGEVEQAARIMIEAIEAERAQSPVWQMFKQGIDLS
ncbi:MAG: cysteine desulfurase [Saprospiraceae bacterium]|nr:cysteine desulfurase [Candidatus Opimibacter iunctus]